MPVGEELDAAGTSVRTRSLATEIGLSIRQCEEKQDFFGYRHPPGQDEARRRGNEERFQ